LSTGVRQIHETIQPVSQSGEFLLKLQLSGISGISVMKLVVVDG